MHKAKPTIILCAILIVLVCLVFPAAILAAGNTVYLQYQATGTTGTQSDPVGSFSAAQGLINDGDNIALIGTSIFGVKNASGVTESWSLLNYSNSKFIIDESFTPTSSPSGGIYIAKNSSLSLSDITIENRSTALDSTTQGIVGASRNTTLTLGANTTLTNTYGPALTLMGSSTNNTLANLIINSNVDVTGNIVVANNYYTIKIAGPLSNPIDILLTGTGTFSVGEATNITAAEGYTLTAEDVAKLNLVNENYHFELLKNGQVIVAEDVPAVSLTGSLDFAPVRAGYTTPPAAQTATVTNISDGAVTITQPESTEHFTVGVISATELAPGATATFEVTPKGSLNPGSYTDTITVNSSGGGVAPTCSAKVDVCYTFECAVTGLTGELPSSTDSSPYFEAFGMINTVRDGGVFYTDPTAYLTPEGERKNDLSLMAFDPNPGYKLSWSIDQYAAGDDETVLTHWDTAPDSLNPCYNYKVTITVGYDEAYTTVTTGKDNAAPGATVKVPVTIANNSGFAAFAFTIGYDAGALELTDITKGDMLTSENGAFTKNIAGNIVTWDDLYNTTAAQGKLFTLTFHIKDAVAGDTYPITVSTQGSQVICNENAEVIPALAIPGAITVEAEDPGTLTPPTLTTDSTDNIVGQAVQITFTDDEAWRNAISEIKVDNTVLQSSQYIKETGKITIAAGVFTEAKDYTITIKATGYTDATVTQTINEAPLSTEVAYTAEGTITAIAPDTVTFADGKFTVPASVTTFTFKDGDKEMKATFADGSWIFAEVTTPPTTCTLTLSGEGLTSNPAAGAIAENTSVTITVTPAAGKQVASFTVGGVDKKAELAGNPLQYTFTITADTTVAVTYEDIPPTKCPVTFTVTDSENVAIVGATVTITGQMPLTTGADGKATIDLADGTYTYGVTATGFNAITDGSVTVNGAAATVDITMTATVVEPNDAEKVATAKANLTLGDLSAVTADLTLPTTQDEATVTWASSNTNVITNDGQVTRPVAGQPDAAVTLTATITVGEVSDTKEFTVTVKAEEAIEPTTHTLTLSGEGLTSDPAAGAIAENISVTITVTPAQGKRVASFTVNGDDKKAELTGTPLQYIFTITADTTVEVTYEAITGTQEATQGGTITVTPNNPVTITVPPGVTNTGIQITQNTPLPTVNIQSPQVDMTIPEGTQVNGSNTIKLPQVMPSSSVNVTAAQQVDLVIKIGSDLGTVTFTRPVRLVLKGQATKSAGFIDNQGNFREITKLASLIGLTNDTHADAVNTALTSAGVGEGAVACGNDLIVWTKHFTEFVAYTPKTSSGGNTGSSGGGSVTPSGQTIGSKGGTIKEAGAEVSFRADAVSSDIKVTIKKLSTGIPSVPSGLNLLGEVYEISSSTNNTFKKPVTITLPFDPDEADNDKHNVGIYCWNNSQWVILDEVKADLKAGKVSGQVNHFSKFAVLLSKKDIPIDEGKEPVQDVIAPVKPALKDISGHWAEANISKLVNTGAISGYPDGTFKPDSSITRAEFATVLVKALNLESRSGKVFNDTTGHWAKDAISTAAGHGIVNGYDTTTFGPDNLITREQMAVMISKAANLNGGEGKTFADNNQIADWAKAAVAATSGKNIISGYPDNTFRPKANATRAEAVTVIVKILN